ncbi:hypothetical protein Leryth_021088 [Lithospermum erythrorhizon]|nr:hypothetical protein Leryth_021088 [Lithospermum erythrorhizon]
MFTPQTILPIGFRRRILIILVTLVMLLEEMSLEKTSQVVFTTFWLATSPVTCNSVAIGSIEF